MSIAPLTIATGAGFTYSSGTKTASGTLTATRAVPAGHSLVIFGAWEGSGGTVPVLTVTDDAGNALQGSVQAINTTTRQVFLGIYTLATGLANGGQVHLGSDTTRGEWAFNAFETGGLSTSPADQTAFDGTKSTAAMTGGTTAATTQADEIVFAAFAVANARTVTAPSGWNLAGTVTSGTHKAALLYKIVTATGAQTGSGTQDSTGAYAGATLTAKAAAVQTVRPVSDTTTTSWTKNPSGAASFAANNSDQDDTSYNRLATPDGAHPLVEVLGNPGTTPPTGAGVTLRGRVRVNGAATASGVLSLVQGSTTIATSTITLAVDGNFGWYELALTPTQVTAIVSGGGFNALKASFNPTAS